MAFSLIRFLMLTVLMLVISMILMFPVAAGCYSSHVLQLLEETELNKNSSQDKVNTVPICVNQSSIIKWHEDTKNQYVCLLQYTREGGYSSPKKIACWDPLLQVSRRFIDNVSEFEQIKFLNSSALEISGKISIAVERNTYLLECSSGPLNKYSTDVVHYQINFKVEIVNSNGTSNGSLNCTTAEQVNGQNFLCNKTNVTVKIVNSNGTSNGSLNCPTAEQVNGQNFLCNKTNVTGEYNPPDPQGKLSTVSSTVQPIEGEGGGKTKLSPGTIAVIVVVAVVVVVFFLAFLWYIVFHRKRRNCNLEQGRQEPVVVYSRCDKI